LLSGSFARIEMMIMMQKALIRNVHVHLTSTEKGMKIAGELIALQPPAM